MDFMGRNGFTWFVGVVEDVADPLQVGRARVRALGFHTENKEELPTNDLPWASMMMPVTSPAVSGLGSTPYLVAGTWVVGFFRDADCQEPIIMGTLPGIPASLPDTKLGFNDPNGVYPAEVNESDVNKLARGTQTHPYTPDSTIAEPADSYAAEYPHNKVYATSSHVKEYDDTPDAERIRERHKSGTFYQVHPNGDIVTHVVGDNYHVIAGDDKLHIKGNVQIVIDNNINLTAATGNITIGTGDIVVNGISLVNHTHTDPAGLAGAQTSTPN